MVAYVSQLAFKTVPHFGKISTKNLASYAPNLMLWGGAWASCVAVYTSGWPIFQDTFYKKLPYFGSYWVKEVLPEDKQY
ncbi:hypothetical protein Kpol_1018p43 [Vanderwaltozyma polyspora DSM 70294]|uniref:Cytochrome b-c1 complex subunit 10 n=1 Tax=Vanderwaltozyma polyspora (strain ATCC 22028 / DSM 70294 / BCRC 21397 / CBS 2163 / NBRC 10782 / NRRL Y-8283 / UCD 57-17) TaxID=436907 RepID=A7TDP2_VANPO|nr:uncharacterized protein Kpol_1018p43 [Vanderwaltozyma polyspora DSM 70294]EDO19512.1 hypothetical protein Kpol_1018p43 [Vanderwaltozyma polyspora DSM 70294]